MTNPLCAAPCKAATSEHLWVTKVVMERAPTVVLTSSHSSLRNTNDLSERSRACSTTVHSKYGISSHGDVLFVY